MPCAAQDKPLPTSAALLEKLDTWVERLEPKKADEAWRRIGWRPEFAAAILEARERKMPVLLWAMNGHPLGCT